MYYPIIDKLKDVMGEIGQGGTLVIEGVQTSSNGGTWTGSFSDIVNALNNGTPCILKFIETDSGTLVNLYVSGVIESANRAVCYLGSSLVTISSDNTFVIHL